MTPWSRLTEARSSGFKRTSAVVWQGHEQLEALTFPECGASSVEGGTPGEVPGPSERGHRQSVRRSPRPVVELGCGVTVYPSRVEGDSWRAVWVEDGRRRYLT